MRIFVHFSAYSNIRIFEYSLATLLTTDDGGTDGHSRSFGISIVRVAYLESAGRRGRTEDGGATG